jgi:hypothetical protein
VNAASVNKTRWLPWIYGKLPLQNDEVAVDLIGPWAITINHQELIFNALTCIDPVTNLTELVRIANKTSAHVAMRFENEWLSCYPCPLQCTHAEDPPNQQRCRPRMISWRPEREVIKIACQCLEPLICFIDHPHP